MSVEDRRPDAPDRLMTGPADVAPLRVVLEPAMSAVESARSAILRHLVPLALDGQVVNRIEVVLEELIGNLVRHGVGYAGEEAIMTVDVAVRPDEIELIVEDNGAEFNPLELTTPSRFTTLEEAELGGLGIPLIRRLSRRVSYRRIELDDGEDGMARNRVAVTIAR